MLSPAELEAKLRDAREQARSEASATLTRRLEDAAAEHRAILENTLTAARADWTAAEAGTLHAKLDLALADLRTALSERLACVLRPMLVELTVRRAVDSFAEALDRLLADPTKPMITITGPADLIAAVKAIRPAADAVDFRIDDGIELTMTADDAHVATRLAASLTSLTAEAGPHGG